MSKIHYFESYDATVELPFMLRTAKQLSEKFGGVFVRLLTETTPLGSTLEQPYECFEVGPDGIKDIAIEDQGDYMAVINTAIKENTYLLISTHDRFSKRLLDINTLKVRPLYADKGVFYLKRKETIQSLRAKYTDRLDSALQSLSYSDHVYDVGDSDIGDKIALETILRDLIYSVSPTVMHNKSILQVVKDNDTGEEPTTLLRSHTNPDGMDTKTLFELLINELRIKQEYIENDTSMVGEVIKRNNKEIMELLRECVRLNSINRSILDNIGEDQGPTGVPRIGKIHK